MGMSYTRIEVTRESARSQLIAYLREHHRNLVLPEPNERAINCVQDWRERTGRAGMVVDTIAKEVLEGLLSSGKAVCTEISVNDSSIMSAHAAYQPLRAKMLIAEEIAELIRMGVLVPLHLKQKDPVNYDFGVALGGHSVMVTQCGLRYLAESSTIPYYAEDYFDQLRQAAEPDEELVGYLTEGLACLRHHLPRAAVIILRLAAEHTLGRLIESTTASLSEGKERKRFEGDVRREWNSLEGRAEVVFRRLEGSTTLIPNTQWWRRTVGNRLRAAFHSIRDIGGKAAHMSRPITLKDASDHYALYACSVYAIVAEIIGHQKSALQGGQETGG
jgi:hypothetical protein